MVPLSVTQAETIARVRSWANDRAIAATATEDRENQLVKIQDAQVKPPAESSPRGGRQVDF